MGFQKINRVITAIDSQPMFDGGVLISVLGRLKVYKYLFKKPAELIIIIQKSDQNLSNFLQTASEIKLEIHYLYINDLRKRIY